MSTCLAMILDVPASQVIDEFHERYKSNYKRASAYLQEKGLCPSPRNVEDRQLWSDRVYLLAVPSLNIDGGMHSVVADTRNDETRILDPNRGREGRRYYREQHKPKEPLGELESDLNGWVIELEVWF